jgi:hypothetical protein
MNPRLLRPLAAGNRTPVFETAGYTRLWAVTTQSGGDITGSAETDTDYYAVKWWDGTVDIYDSGDPFSKAAAGNQRAFEVYPVALPSLLLNFNGTNGSTTFTDSSPNELTVTAEGDAAISTAQSKFGGASAFLGSGDGDYISIDEHPSLDMESGDFTIEFWAYFRPQTAEYSAWLATAAGWSPGSFVFGYDRQANGGSESERIYIARNGGLASGDTEVSGDAAVGDTVFAPNQWRHVAVVRQGSSLKVYIDGAEEIDVEITAPLNLAYGGAMLLGGSFDGALGANDDYMDDLRIVKGVALYTANFTPPGGELEASPMPAGDFIGFDLSDNSLTQVRSEGVTLASSGGAQTGGYQTPSGFWSWGPYFSPVVAESGIISDNLLTAVALDQFYTDLDAGSGFLFVAGNPGIDADDPTIATAKGYTVFGSVPPETGLLVNFNGDNNSTTFIDSSPNEYALTANGDAKISTTQSKFGGASGYFDGDGDYVELADNSALNLGGDFTIECWIYPVSFPEAGRAALVSKWGLGGAQGWMLQIDGSEFFFPYPNGESLITAHGLQLDEWAHIAVSRAGTDLRLFINGILLASETNGVNMAAEAPVWIGGQEDFPEWFHGYIDDVRITVNTARYVINFTPPTAELEA